MLNLELYLAFCVATAALILMPGPIVTLVVANSLKHGSRTGLATVIGANSGSAILIAAGGFGLTTMLAVAGDIFEWVRWAGVAYLVWLGLREWRSALAGVRDGALPPDERPKGVFWHGFLVALTNPKTIFFFVAFFPQFLDPQLAAGPQIAILIVTFLVIATCLDSMYALLAGRLRGRLMDPRRARIRHGITGTLLIGTGIGLALARRNG